MQSGSEGSWWENHLLITCSYAQILESRNRIIVTGNKLAKLQKHSTKDMKQVTEPCSSITCNVPNSRIVLCVETKTISLVEKQTKKKPTKTKTRNKECVIQVLGFHMLWQPNHHEVLIP